MAAKELIINEFIENLASKAPTPGGGGAAALCGTIGTALGNMVCALTVGKKKYADVESEIIDISKRCSEIQQELLALIDGDAEVFKPLAAAYSMPTDTEEQKAEKERVLESCSKDACMVPLHIMEKCCEAIELVERTADIGSRLAVSDAGCGAAMLRGALQAASLNIFINTKGIKDRSFADDINGRAKAMLTEYTNRAEAVFNSVFTSLDN